MLDFECDLRFGPKVSKCILKNLQENLRFEGLRQPLACQLHKSFGWDNEMLSRLLFEFLVEMQKCWQKWIEGMNSLWNNYFPIKLNRQIRSPPP